VEELVRSFLKGDLAKSRELHALYYPLFRDLFIEPNPVPIKTALATKGICRSDVRLPLCEITDSNREILLKTLRSTGVL
jgi:4-hydroxy-tetrahydrodipicolinate synthase